MEKKIEKIVIVGKRWFQKLYGNTYHSVIVFVNDEKLRADFIYGYGDHYLQTAQGLLEKAGYIWGDFSNHHDKRRKFLDLLNGNYSVSDVSKKKDLF